MDVSPRRCRVAALGASLLLVGACGGGSARPPAVTYPTGDERGALPAPRADVAAAMAEVIGADYPPSGVDIARVRLVARAALPAGGSLAVVALPVPARGGLCVVQLVDGRAAGGSCALDPTTQAERAFAGTSVRPIRAAGAAVLLEAVVPLDTARLTLAYEDGARQDVGLIGAWGVTVVPGDRLRAGHRPATLTARDVGGATLASLPLGTGVLPEGVG